MKDPTQELSFQLEEAVQLLCEQIAHLRQEVEELKSEIRDEVFPRLRPRKPALSPEGMQALERLARIRRESIL
ncbi:MAG: hypothetical protein KC910_11140 [Candidatus Eremiobacteraeota bacterium]|nr:hypothetical protein [Candidatus Eremiobacteraeota bacterium]